MRTLYYPAYKQMCLYRYKAHVSVNFFRYQNTNIIIHTRTHIIVIRMHIINLNHQSIHVHRMHNRNLNNRIHSNVNAKFFFDGLY